MTTLWDKLVTFEFAQPAWLLLLGLLPLVWRRLAAPAPLPALTYPSLGLLAGLVRPAPARRTRPARWLRLLAVALLIFALARPRIERGMDEEKAEGVDIMLVLDASRSMDSKDFDFDGRKVSRRVALEHVIGQFIGERTRDRIGVVAFAEKPFLVSPLTLDHSWMMQALHEMNTSLGTAIGSGVEAAVDLLRQFSGETRVIIVVTDGLNTSGSDPLESARLARRSGVRVYTIGVVSYAEMKTSNLDGLMLSQMARLTGGQFFQAADTVGLEAIYQQIDQLERREFKQARLRAYRELFPGTVLLAMGLVMTELLCGAGRRLRLP
ncbi:MAG: VWA domain-containing protein [Lacunisphaera sp.]